MTQFPKVSVITVCLNAADALAKTLENIALQDYPDKETIVIDGASVDNTHEVIKQAVGGGNITRYVSEKDDGIYDAMNKGVNLSTGEYCIFMNAGDLFAAPDTLRRIFAVESRADVIYGDVIKAGSDGQPYVKRAEPPHNAHRMFFCHQSSLTRTACLRKFPFDIRYTMSADFKFFKTLWKQGCVFRQLDFPVSVFDVCGVSNTNRAKGLRQNIAIIRETDSLPWRIRLLPRLYFVLLMLRLRSK